MAGEVQVREDMTQLSGSVSPIGTLEEVQALGMNPASFATCSAPVPVRPGAGGEMTGSRGCQYYRKCKVRRLAAKRGRPTPAKIGVAIVLSKVDGGAGDEKLMSCVDYHRSGLDHRMGNMEDSGEFIRILGIEGDPIKITSRESEKLHKKPDPSCEACMDPSGPCLMRKQVNKVYDLADPKNWFPRPGEKFHHAGAAQRVREDVLESLQRDAQMDALSRQGVSVDDEEAESGDDGQVVPGRSGARRLRR